MQPNIASYPTGQSQRSRRKQRRAAMAVAEATFGAESGFAADMAKVGNTGFKQPAATRGAASPVTSPEAVRAAMEARMLARPPQAELTPQEKIKHLAYPVLGVLGALAVVGAGGAAGYFSGKALGARVGFAMGGPAGAVVGAVLSAYVGAMLSLRNAICGS